MRIVDCKTSLNAEQRIRELQNMMKQYKDKRKISNKMEKKIAKGVLDLLVDSSDRFENPRVPINIKDKYTLLQNFKFFLCNMCYFRKLKYKNKVCKQSSLFKNLGFHAPNGDFFRLDINEDMNSGISKNDISRKIRCIINGTCSNGIFACKGIPSKIAKDLKSHMQDINEKYTYSMANEENRERIDIALKLRDIMKDINTEYFGYICYINRKKLPPDYQALVKCIDQLNTKFNEIYAKLEQFEDLSNYLEFLQAPDGIRSYYSSNKFVTIDKIKQWKQSYSSLVCMCKTYNLNGWTNKNQNMDPYVKRVIYNKMVTVIKKQWSDFLFNESESESESKPKDHRKRK